MENTDIIIDIADHPQVWRWLKELSKTDINGYVRLTGDNTERLKRLYGKPLTTDAKGEEWEARWNKNFNRLDWIILTGEKTGTIFRIKTPLSVDEFVSDSRIGIGIINYLQELCDILMGEYNL